MSVLNAFRASVCVVTTLIVGSIPLLLHQACVEHDRLGTVKVQGVNFEPGTTCSDLVARTEHHQLSCSEFHTLGDISVQEWAWEKQVIDVIQHHKVELSPIELDTIDFYAGDSFGSWKYAIYRLLLKEGYLNLSSKQQREEIEYLLPELPFPIQGKERERVLTSTDEVTQWKTEVVQQAEFSNRYVEYMLDIQDELQVFSADIWVGVDMEFPFSGNVLTQVIWEKSGCIVRSRWWSQTREEVTLQVPIFQRDVSNEECVQQWTEWCLNPSLDNISILVEWMGQLEDGRVHSKTRFNGRNSDQ